MKKQLQLLILMLIPIISWAQSPSFQWAKTYQTNPGSFPQQFAQNNVVRTDASGNVYTAGFFSGTVDFDPGSGTYSLNTATGTQEAFISKLDAQGNFLWVNRIGGSSSSNEVLGLTFDSKGNVYTTGYFSGIVDFDSSPNTYTLDGNQGTVFINKIDANGNFKLAKNFGGSSLNKGMSICVDTLGNIYSTGRVNGSSDLDPGPGTVTAPWIGGDVSFISKLDSLGNLVWVNTINGSANCYGQAIMVDNSLNVFVANNFAGNCYITSGAATATLASQGSDFCLSKFDASGNLSWIKQIGGSGNELVHSAAIDKSNNIILTGVFTGTVDFDPGSGVSNVNGNFQGNDIFIMKMDANGGFVWAKGIGNFVEDNGYSVCTDEQDNCYITGNYDATLDCDPGPSTFNLSCTGSSDVFILKLNSSGNFIWAGSLNGNTQGEARSIFVDQAFNIYTGGSYTGTMDFDCGSGTFNITSQQKDAFIHKMSQTPAGINENSFAVDMFTNVYPNPNNGNFMIETRSSANITIMNSMGQVISSGSLPEGTNSISLSEQANGIYFIRVENQKKQGVIKIIKH